MEVESMLLVLTVFAVSVVLTGVMRRFAVARGLLDVPNGRSSHSTATPRGGGLAIVVPCLIAVVVMVGQDKISTRLAMAVIIGGGAVAAVGFKDDRKPVSARVRFPIHLAAAIWAVAWIGAPTQLQFGHHLVVLGWSGFLLGVLGIAWAINLFNFMDGIDGIAASEAIFVAAASALLTFWRGGSIEVFAMGLLLAAASGGFLVWNWPPAKIFMGDVGSGYLGYLLGVLGLVGCRHDPIALWIWLILGGVFFIDATVTLARRLVRAERVFEAHRSHAYQWLARRWRSHKSVTVAVIVVNLFWLLPCAMLAELNPTWASWWVILALAPVTIGALCAGAGRREVA